MCAPRKEALPPRLLLEKISSHRTVAVAPPPGTCLTVSVAQAAELLGVSRESVDGAIRRGDLPILRFGTKIVVPAEGIYNLIEAALRATPRGDETRWRSNQNGTRRKTAR
jgi:excisionase family DNA binding protein